MHECTVEHLDSAMTAIRESIAGETEVLKHVEPKYEQLRGSFDPDAFSYCASRYINAELDFRTPGDRGLGRMTTFIPRLGAYFRRQMSTLSDDELSRLYLIIQDLLIRGYLTHALVVEEPLQDPKVSDGASIYEAWVPAIYGSDPSEMGPNLWTWFTAFTDSALDNFKGFLQPRGMKGGGLFSQDKTELIGMYYACAGFGIRIVQVGRM